MEAPEQSVSTGNRRQPKPTTEKKQEQQQLTKPTKKTLEDPTSSTDNQVMHFGEAALGVEAQNRKKRKPPNSNPLTSAPTASELQPKAKRITSSARQRAELEYLRQRVQALETQLSDLQAQRRLEQHQSEEQADQQLDAEALQRQAWEKLAMNQMRQKHESLKENEELKSALQEHLKLAKGLDWCFRMHPELLTGAAPRPLGDLPIHHALDDPVGWRRLDASVQSLERVFEDTKLLHLRREERKVQVLNECKPFLCEQELFHMRVIQARTFVFAIKDVCDEMWNSVHDIPWGEDIQVQVKTLGDRTLLEIKLILTMGSTPFVYNSTMIMKRFCKLEGHPIVWETISKIESMTDSTEKFEVLEHGWSRLESYHSIDGGGTLCRSCVQFVPTLTITQTSDPMAACFNQLRVTPQSPQFTLWCEIAFDRYLRLIHDTNLRIKDALLKKKRAGLLTSY